MLIFKVGYFYKKRTSDLRDIEHDKTKYIVINDYVSLIKELDKIRLRYEKDSDFYGFEFVNISKIAVDDDVVVCL